MIIWITGQHCAGKTTVARELAERLLVEDRNVISLDGDVWRKLSQNYDYSERGRRKNLFYAMRAAMAMEDEFTVVICSFISPFREMREKLKCAVDTVEVYLHTNRVPTHPERLVAYEPPLSGFVDICTDSRNSAYMNGLNEITAMALAKTMPAEVGNEDFSI